MRLFLGLIIGGLLGWIAGSLYPAPSALLAPIQRQLNGGGEQTSPATATTQPAPEAATTTATATATGAATTTTTAAAHPASSGPVDQATLNQYRAWIAEARQAHPYSASEQQMYAVMMCESGGRAGLVNPAGPHSGLFQYSGSTWRGAWNTYRDQGILDARAQIFATALAWHNGMQGQWGCH